jgi:hypothetical protein
MICKVKKNGKYYNLMKKKYIATYRLQYKNDNRSDKELLQGFEDFLKAEEMYLQSINLNEIEEDEFIAYVFFHT